MNQSAVFSLSRKLADAVLVHDTLLIEGANPADSVVRLLRKEMAVLAADLDAAWNEKQPLDPWTRWNPRASIIAHSPGCAE